jgi:hypothetical protein
MRLVIRCARCQRNVDAVDLIDRPNKTVTVSCHGQREVLDLDTGDPAGDQVVRGVAFTIDRG